MSAESRTQRRHSDSPVEPPRSEFERDRDRILYCSALRRLAGVSQVVAAAEGHVFHNRLTHVLKVAQIGRGLAEQVLHDTTNKELADALGGLSADVVEAAALAHDLGHPPFGHIAEKELDRLVRDHASDGFEGNAQSFRIVTRLSVRSNDMDGLNLTRATLNALLKYPWQRGTSGDKKEKKWGAYHAEKDDFAFARQGYEDDRKSLEAELMDWADDIAYSVYDMEDFYRAGKVPLDRLFGTTLESKDISPEAEKFLERAFARRDDKWDFEKGEVRETLKGLGVLFPFRDPYSGKREQRAALRTVTSTLVARYIRAVTLEEKAIQEKASRIAIKPQAKIEVEILKELTWQYVIEDPALTTQQYGYRHVIKRLFDVFLEATEKEKDWVLFPIGVQEQLRRVEGGENRDRALVRIVADFIASMTEQQGLEMYQRVAGISFGSVLKSVM